jgi:hypothetical protein
MRRKIAELVGDETRSAVPSGTALSKSKVRSSDFDGAKRPMAVVLSRKSARKTALRPCHARAQGRFNFIAIMRLLRAKIKLASPQVDPIGPQLSLLPRTSKILSTITAGWKPTPRGSIGTLSLGGFTFVHLACRLATFLAGFLVGERAETPQSRSLQPCDRKTDAAAERTNARSSSAGRPTAFFFHSKILLGFRRKGQEAEIKEAYRNCLIPGFHVGLPDPRMPARKSVRWHPRRTVTNGLLQSSDWRRTRLEHWSGLSVLAD